MKYTLALNLILIFLATSCERLSIELPSKASIQRIEVLPATKEVPKNVYFAMQAIAYYSDGTYKDITEECDWSSDDVSVASIDSSTLALTWVVGQNTGQAIVKASYEDFTSQSVLNITGATLSSIDIAPNAGSLAKGLTQQFTATGTFSDASTVDITNTVEWASTDALVASVTNAGVSRGLVTALTLGNVNIEAEMDGVTHSTAFTVSPAELLSIAVSPSNISIAKGLTQQFTATGTYTDASSSDVTSAATWSSSDPAKISISNLGLATALNQGTALVQATLGTITGSTLFMIDPASVVSISINPLLPSKAKGLSQQFTATATYSDATTGDATSLVTWSSSNTGVASIANSGGSKGLAQALNVGVSTIQATLGSASASTVFTVTAAQLVSIAVTPNNSTIIIALNKQFTATGTYTDGSVANITTSVNWNCSNALVALISSSFGSEGRATGVGLGSAVITACQGAICGQANVNGILF